MMGASAHTITSKFINKFSPPGGCLLLKETVITARRRGWGETKGVGGGQGAAQADAGTREEKYRRVSACVSEVHAHVNHVNESRAGFSTFSCQQTRVETARRGSGSPLLFSPLSVLIPTFSRFSSSTLSFVLSVSCLTSPHSNSSTAFTASHTQRRSHSTRTRSLQQESPRTTLRYLWMEFF